MTHCRTRPATSSCLRTSRSSPAQRPHHTRLASQQALGKSTPTHPHPSQQQQAVRHTRTSSSSSLVVLVVLQMVMSSLPHHPAAVGSRLPSRPAGGHTTAACLGATAAAAAARRSPSCRQGRLLVVTDRFVCSSACCFAPLSLALDHHPAGRHTAQGASSSAAPSQ